MRNNSLIDPCDWKLGWNYCWLKIIGRRTPLRTRKHAKVMRAMWNFRSFWRKKIKNERSKARKTGDDEDVYEEGMTDESILVWMRRFCASVAFQISSLVLGKWWKHVYDSVDVDCRNSCCRATSCLSSLLATHDNPNCTFTSRTATVAAATTTTTFVICEVWMPFTRGWCRRTQRWSPNNNNKNNNNNITQGHSNMQGHARRPTNTCTEADNNT